MNARQRLFLVLILAASGAAGGCAAEEPSVERLTPNNPFIAPPFKDEVTGETHPGEHFVVMATKMNNPNGQALTRFDVFAVNPKTKEITYLGSSESAGAGLNTGFWYRAGGEIIAGAENAAGLTAGDFLLSKARFIDNHSRTALNIAGGSANAAGGTASSGSNSNSASSSGANAGAASNASSFGD